MSPRQALCAIALVAFVLCALACSGSSPVTRPGDDAPPPDSSTKDKTDKRDPAKDEPDYREAVGEFLTDVNKLGFGAEKKYKNKVIEVSGEVAGEASAFGWSDEQKTGFFRLKGEGAPGSLPCYAAEPEPWTKVAPGQKVTVKGLWSTGVGLGLSKCVFVQTGTYAGLAITAEQLARDVQTDGNRYN
jgi:hypothetical protein